MIGIKLAYYRNKDWKSSQFVQAKLISQNLKFANQNQLESSVTCINIFTFFAMDLQSIFE